MGILLVLACIVIALIGGGAAMIRRLEHEPETWHVDPLTAPKPATPNSYRVGPEGTNEADAVAPVFDRPVDDLAARFDRTARSADLVKVLAGDAQDGHVTYVQTSRLFSFPDYISVKFIEVDSTTSTLAVFSRSRLGKSDLGVNKKRVEEWLGQLDS